MVGKGTAAFYVESPPRFELYKPLEEAPSTPTTVPFPTLQTPGQPNLKTATPLTTRKPPNP